MSGDRVIRAGLVISLTVVTVIAVAVSYGHLYDLAVRYGETGVAAAVLPVTVDGLILACSLVIVNAARHRSRPPVLAWLLLLAGIGATLAGNVAHGLTHGWPGSLVAGWPAVVAAGMFHLAIGEIRRGREVSPDPAEVDQDDDQDAEPWTEDRPVGMELWDDLETAPPAPAEPVATGDPLTDWFHGTAPAGVDQEPADRAATGPVVATAETTDPGPVATGPEVVATAGTGDPDLAPVIATARDRFADDLANGHVPSIRKIREVCQVGYPRAVRVRDALTAHTTP